MTSQAKNGKNRSTGRALEMQSSLGESRNSSLKITWGLPEMIVRMQDFRCFLDTGSIEIKPITILIGENSTGKTSFLAALRILMEWANRAESNSFNRSPYFLGGFDQISHANSVQKQNKNSFVLSISSSLHPIERGRVDNSQG